MPSILTKTKAAKLKQQTVLKRAIMLNLVRLSLYDLWDMKSRGRRAHLSCPTFLLFMAVISVTTARFICPGLKREDGKK